ncbi:MAG: hypothetical protein HC889_01130 [Synechococcaceae cyanobacterium SM1_2_3]|nr:hypothetical protein [Synechococcaceae cyanobacterium SM1_2_3]
MLAQVSNLRIRQAQAQTTLADLRTGDGESNPVTAEFNRIICYSKRIGVIKIEGMDFLTKEHRARLAYVKGMAILIKWQRGQNAGATFTPSVGNLWRLGYGLILTESPTQAVKKNGRNTGAVTG